MWSGMSRVRAPSLTPLDPALDLWSITLSSTYRRVGHCLESKIGLLSVTGMTPENKFGGSFGANEWLVDEMYEQYLRDPNSVTEEWKSFFAGYKPGSNGASANNNVASNTVASNTVANGPAASPGTPPVPKRDLKAKSAPQSAPVPTAPQVSVPTQSVTSPSVSTPAPSIST
ncbi:MAG: 2-oxoglutarate dehydrogenase component, partial [Actinomycetota bacterium]